MLKHFKKGSPEARAFMAKLRAMRGKKNPLTRKEVAMTVRAVKYHSDEAKYANRYDPLLAAYHSGAAGALSTMQRIVPEGKTRKQYTRAAYKAYSRAKDVRVRIGPPAVQELHGPGWYVVRKRNPPLLILGNPTKKAVKFIEKKIRKLRREGYKQKQTVAIAYSMARKKRFAVSNPRKTNPDRFGQVPKGFPPRVWRDLEFQRELATFRRRHGAGTPVHVSTVKVPKGFPKYMTAFGTAPHSVYDAPKQSHRGKFKHVFGRSGKHRPWLVSSTSRGPKFLAFVGGRFKAKKTWLYD